MYEILKFILFRTVLIVVALHAIITHPHENELTLEKHLKLHQESNSLIGIIRLAFHENNDENLDNLMFVKFENVKKLNYNLTYSTTSSLNSTLPTEIERKTKKTNNSSIDNFNKLLFVKLNGLRGPPLSA